MNNQGVPKVHISCDGGEPNRSENGCDGGGRHDTVGEKEENLPSTIGAHGGEGTFEMKQPLRRRRERRCPSMMFTGSPLLINVKGNRYGWRSRGEQANSDAGIADNDDDDNQESGDAGPAEIDNDDKQVNDNDRPVEKDEDDDDPTTNDKDKPILEETEDGGVGLKGSDGGGIMGEGRQKEKEDSGKSPCGIESESKGVGELLFWTRAHTQFSWLDVGICNRQVSS
ncbi:hypothetical protein VNO80_30682 [Phaseolus coccineus]|uniref:Uncharacterized protein n=1 Tax=Phaseolus coccineus TaxID=3886 RepID=A0AAN9LDM6_PHACN